MSNWKYCWKTAKRQYLTLASARGGAANSQQYEDQKLSCYLCSSCKFWHLTSARQRKGQFPKRDDKRQLRRK